MTESTHILCAEHGEGNPLWTVAIFSSREPADILAATLMAAIEAIKGVRAVIDVVVNGNEVLARQFSEVAMASSAGWSKYCVVRVWYIQGADKAHAWNQYVHMIWPGSAIAFFVDGYARVKSDAFHLIASGLDGVPTALGASGVPTVGRHARRLREEMMKNGGIHGNLYALRGEVMCRLRAGGIRLPVSIYRTDSTLGAVINFNLNPHLNPWDPRRMFVHPDATWDFVPLNWANLCDLKSHWKRVARQAQGDLENAAVKNHLAIHKRSPEALPRTTMELIGGWIASNRREAYTMFLRGPLRLLAWQKLKRSTPMQGLDVPPRLIYQTQPQYDKVTR